MTKVSLVILPWIWLVLPALALETAPDGTLGSRKDGAWHLYLSDAQAEARRTGKPMLLFFTGSDWCKECWKLKRTVLDRPEFIAWAAKKVILLEVDFPIRRKLPEERMRESDELHERYKLFHVASKPCILLVTPEGAVIGKQRLKADRSSPAAWIRDAEGHLAKARSD